MTPDSDFGTVLYRLDLLDKRLERMEGNVERLAFVSLDLYRSEQAAQNERIESTARLAMWALGLVCTTTIGLIVTGLVRLAAA